MTDRAFELSLSTVTALVVIWIMAGSGLALAGIAWAHIQTGWLVFLTVLSGLAVLLVGGGTLLRLWGKNYMARG
jgi:hypothetical protein